jgi:predicted metal-binding transcription factor (methanogenesis marker protein 9)
MDRSKRKRLEAAGWNVGTVRDFLELSPEEESYIELKLQLAKNLQKRRREKNITQVEFARMLKSSQSRVAKMEAGDPTVSVDLLIRSLLALGASPKSLLRALPQ